MQNTATMHAMRLHESGGSFRLDEIARPRVERATDVVVQVKASGIVPNLRNVMRSYGERAYLTVPDLPAIYGLDTAGVVAEIGSDVTGFAVGDRVYINPGRSCGTCHACRIGDRISCQAFTFQGYFGFGPRSKEIYRRYPYGGLCQYATAPADGLVKLPEQVSFEQAARFGYLGTAYSGLRKAGVAAGRTLLVCGGTGTLGLCAVQIARAMGATKILCVARNEANLARVRALDPTRVRTFSYGSGTLKDWVLAETEGSGVDAVVDAIGPGASHQITLDCISSLRRGGSLVEIGAMSDPMPVNMHELMCARVSLIGSLWFSVAEGQDLAAMVAAGTLDLSVFEHHTYALEQANEALADAERRVGGFVNVVISQ
ncbi:MULTISPECIES: alcohol dehydrogenase catalytic domain-containing protein [Caballeronia]|uniref:Zinc-binding dehydrogenase n=1 Tax=Caballeronia jiangsuensis TaxID=1458357 RepID=A0ABW9CDU6_9BURK|nr:zinc-binding dehydrogenase [Caballeronia sp. GaOx3]